MQNTRDPFAQPSLFSMNPTTKKGYDFQITMFLEDSAEPILSKTIKNAVPARDGTYITTYSVPDHTLWSRPMRIFITDLTNYTGSNMPLLKLRMEYTATPDDPNLRTLPFHFQTREFKHADQRTIKVQVNTVYRIELHFA